MNNIEIWKDVKGYENIYKVSNFGNIKSLDRIIYNKGNKSYCNIKGKTLKKCINTVGYYCVVLCKAGKVKTFNVHQLQAIAFLNHIPNKYDSVINHKDLNKLNNNISNLEIVTQRENSNKKHLVHSSEFVGVSWRETNKKWVANIVINNKLFYLGLYENEQSASDAYNLALDNWTHKKITPEKIKFTSIHKGICFVTEKQKWCLLITKLKKRKFYGYFDTEEKAYLRKKEIENV